MTVAGPLAELLRAKRERINNAVKLSRLRRPGLRDDDVHVLLRDVIGPVAESLHEKFPAKAGDALTAIFERGLSWMGARLLGPGAQYPELTIGWRELLCRLPELVGADPLFVASAACNAMYYLCATPGARVQDWVETMMQVGPRCASPNAFFDAGAVAAWRCGFPRLRQAALQACLRLPDAIAREALGVSAAEPSMHEIVSALQRDPWLKPDRVGRADKGALKAVARVGGFRGFGGCFLQPPVLKRTEHGIMAVDREAAWLLAADAFGATLIRFGEPSSAEAIKGADVITITARGAAVCGNLKADFPEYTAAASVATSGKTLALVPKHSHWVHLIAPVSG